jgi:hypothetical protein
MSLELITNNKDRPVTSDLSNLPLKSTANASSNISPLWGSTMRHRCIFHASGTTPSPCARVCDVLTVCFHISNASGPDILITAIAALPGGVESAYIVRRCASDNTRGGDTANVPKYSLIVRRCRSIPAERNAFLVGITIAKGRECPKLDLPSACQHRRIWISGRNGQKDDCQTMAECVPTVVHLVPNSPRIAPNHPLTLNHCRA